MTAFICDNAKPPLRLPIKETARCDIAQQKWTSAEFVLLPETEDMLCFARDRPLRQRLLMRGNDYEPHSTSLKQFCCSKRGGHASITKDPAQSEMSSAFRECDLHNPDAQSRCLLNQ